MGGKPSTTSQTGADCYQTDEQGRRYDRYGRHVFADDEAHTMGNTSDEEERAGDFSEEEDDDLGVRSLEVGVSMATSVEKVGRQELQETEDQLQRNKQFAERCCQEAAKIIQTGGHGGMAPIPHKSAKNLKVKKQPTSGVKAGGSRSGRQAQAQKKPCRY